MAERPWETEEGPCSNCNGARSVPDLGEYEDGYAPCPSCVIDAVETFVVFKE
jgi:hypothetical protein